MKILAPYIKHYKSNIRLAFPVMITQLGHPLVGFSSSVILGHFAGTIPLAALALSNGYFNLLMIIGIGISYGLTPLIAHANGSRNYFLCGRLLAHSLVVNILTGLLLVIVALSGSVFTLDHLGQQSNVVAQAKPLLLLTGISLLPLMVFLTFKQFVEGLGLTRQAMQVSLWGNAINIVIGIILVKGMFGVTPMGVKGVGIAAIADRTIMAVAMAWYAIKSKRTRLYVRGFSLLGLKIGLFKNNLRSGLPIALQNVFEISAFSAAVFMTGWLGAAPLAAYQATMIMVAMIYYAACGIGTAAAVNTGFFRGRKEPQQVRFSALSNYHLVIAFHLLTGLALFVFRGFLSRFFSADAAVIAMVIQLLIFASVVEVFDGLQIIGLSVLRGMGDVKFPTLIAFVAYWLLALPLAYVLGLHTHLGVFGIWVGLYSGLAIASGGLYLRFNRLSKQTLSY